MSAPLPQIEIRVEGDPASGEPYYLRAIVAVGPDAGLEIGSIELFGARYVAPHVGSEYLGCDAVVQAEVLEQYRRRGLATRLYAEAERLSGRRLVPWSIVDGGDEPMSEDAKAFWRARGAGAPKERR